MKEWLELFNHWWKTGAVKKELAPEYRRDLFQELVKNAGSKQIACVYGLRRVGKSTLFYQIIDYLISTQKTSVERILYFSFDQKTEGLKKLVDEYLELHSLKLEEGKYFFFFDEIQKLDDWQNKLKIYYDLYPNIKFFVSGSSNIALVRNSSESLAGRTKFFLLEPLNFREWLALNKAEIDLSKIGLYEKEVKQLLKWFLKTPFPEIAGEKEEIKIKEFVQDFVLARILYYDLNKEFKDIDLALLEALKNLVYGNPGITINFDQLASDLKRGKENIIKHINYLEEGLLIRVIKNYRAGALSSSRKFKKAYPYHPCFCTCIEESKIIENAVVTLLNAEYYWREQEKEVDIILNKTPIEVKYSEKIVSQDANTVTYFMKKFKKTTGIIVTKNTEDNRNPIKLIPFWKMAAKPEMLKTLAAS